jgi:hypothetical protein
MKHLVAGLRNAGRIPHPLGEFYFTALFYVFT